MSVLIKGMEMPKNCEGCDLADWYNGNICCYALRYTVDVSEMEQLHTMCPLVEVPTPHGRLIDADELLEHKTDHDMISTHLIYNAPTVIEAED